MLQGEYFFIGDHFYLQKNYKHPLSLIFQFSIQFDPILFYLMSIDSMYFNIKQYDKTNWNKI